MLVDCDHIVQQKVEMGNDRTGRRLGYLQVKAGQDRSSL